MSPLKVVEEQTVTRRISSAPSRYTAPSLEAYESDTVKISCPPGFQTQPANGLASCINGTWKPEVPSCIRENLALSPPMVLKQASLLMSSRRKDWPYN